MKCCIEPHHIDQPPTHHQVVRLNSNGDLQSPLQRFVDEFLQDHSITKLAIQCHHIILRSILGKFEHLSCEKNAKQGNFSLE
jgi:hypothetical protein